MPKPTKNRRPYRIILNPSAAGGTPWMMVLFPLHLDDVVFATTEVWMLQL